MHLMTINIKEIIGYVGSIISFMYLTVKIIRLGIRKNYQNHQALEVQNFEIENKILIDDNPGTNIFTLEPERASDVNVIEQT